MASNKPKTSPKVEQPLARAVVIAIAVSFVAVVLTVVVGRVFIGRITLANKVIDGKQKAEQQLGKNIDAVRSLSLEYASLGAAKTVIADALPNTGDFPALSSLMESIAKASGVALLSVDSPVSGAAASKSANGPQEFNFTASVSGSYISLLALIKNLEVSARPMRVTAVSVDGTSDALSVRLSITTYYQDKANLTTRTKVVQ